MEGAFLAGTSKPPLRGERESGEEGMVFGYVMYIVAIYKGREGRRDGECAVARCMEVACAGEAWEGGKVRNVCS